MKNHSIRVRFAPSPTGWLHIGSARTALYNWLYARKTGGTFVLRIEDSDAARSTESSYRSILEALEWLGLDWDEGPEKDGPYGPYIQSARSVLYHTEARKLLESGAAYPCFCSPEELEEVRKEAAGAGGVIKYDGRCRRMPSEEVRARLARSTPHVIRFHIPDGSTRLYDVIRGTIEFDNDELDDFVIIKSDGRPTYNFAVVVDDAGMRITHVIRGDDHISNTPRQILLYKALGYPLPKFAHLPMILGSDRSRLSKRHGATSIQEYRQMGFLRDALVNYLALLGWAYDGKTEIFSRESLIEKFSLKRVSKNPAAFDLEKLNYINAEHFKKMDLMEKATLIYGLLEEKKVFPPDFAVPEWHSGSSLPHGGKNNAGTGKRAELPRLALIIKSMGARLKRLDEIPGLLRYFYKDDYARDGAAYREYLQDPAMAARLKDLARTIESVDPFERSAVETAVRTLAGELGISAGDLIHPCRVALTGQAVSPDIFTVIQLLGKAKVVERLLAAAEHISQLSQRGSP